MTTSGRNQIRVLVAKPGLDGHDRGAKVLVHALNDAGMKVTYTGLRQSPAAIIDAALREDVDVLCVSVLSGAHLVLFAEIMAGLRGQANSKITVLGGGVIPDQDIPILKEMGVREVFTPGASLTVITDYINDVVSAGAAINRST